MADSSFSALYSLRQMLSPRVNNPKTPKKPLKPRDGELKSIADAINKREKDVVLNIRINKQDLDNIKEGGKKTRGSLSDFYIRSYS